MENPQAAAVINNLRLLLDSPDLVQDLLDDVRADLNLTNALLVDAAAYVNKCLATEAALRAFFPSAMDEERTDCAVLTQHVGLLLAEALFTSQVFLPPRGLGMVEFWVNPSISPDPHISPHFPSFPPISQSFLFTLNFGMGGDGRGW
jgi:hypothetical protein